MIQTSADYEQYLIGLKHAKYLTLKDCAVYMRCSISTVEKKWPEWAAQEGVRVFRKKGLLRILRGDIDRMMENNAVVRA